MPLDLTTGQYVPLDAVQRAKITSYAAGVLRREPNINPHDLGIRIGQRGGVHIDNYDSIVVNNLIRDARAENAAGAAAQADPGEPPDPGAIPTVAQDPADSGRVVTTYVVEVVDPATGDRTTSMEQSIDDIAPSHDEIMERINANRRAYVATVGSPPATTTPIEDLKFSIIILSVARAR